MKAGKFVQLYTELEADEGRGVPHISKHESDEPLWSAWE